MGLFGERWPYSNFHDVNLDWFIKEMTEFLKKYKSVDEHIDLGIDNIDNAATEAIQRIDYAVAHVERRYIILGDSYGTRTTNAGYTYYDIVKSGLRIPDENCYFRAVSGAAFGHQLEGYSFYDIIRNMTIESPDTITDIIIQCGANDIAYTTQQEITGMNNFINYVNEHFPKAKCWLFACGIIMDTANLGKRRRETLVTFRSMAQKGFQYVLNSESVLMNTVLLESDRTHPNTYGVQYLAWALAETIIAGYCTNHYRSYSEQINAIASIEDLPSGTTLGSQNIELVINTDNELTELCNDGRIVLGFNINNVTLTPDNYINIDMDNCFGLPPENQKKYCIIANGATGDSIPGLMSYGFVNDKYRLSIRPMYNISTGSDNNYIHIYYDWSFLNS